MKNDKVKELKTSIGGSHYLKYKEYQPIEFIVDRGYNFIEGNIFKYLCRYKYKDGLQDLKKARHYCELWKLYRKTMPKSIRAQANINTFLFKNDVEYSLAKLLLDFDITVSCYHNLKLMDTFITNIDQLIESL